MNAQADFETIAALDLEPIKSKLMHAQSGEGWSREKADAVEIEYRRFLFLMKKFPQESSAPLFDVDIFWHYHILDTMKYMQDCEAVFGHYLHHYPYLGLHDDEEDAALHAQAGARMKELYDTVFGEEAFARAADHLGAARTAWCFVPPQSAVRSRSTREGAAVTSAWCFVPPKSPVQPRTLPEGAMVATAWCFVPPQAAAGIELSVPARNAAASAWCFVPPSQKAQGVLAPAAN